MNFQVLTLFPEIPRAYFESSIMARAVERGIVSFNLVNIRDFALDKHKTCDDSPYGGGAGMLMLPEPLDRALAACGAEHKRVIYVTPSGTPFSQDLARSLCAEEELLFLCGRYEGIDERIVSLWVDDEISIGDYVVSSGEVAALVVIDAVYRLIDGVISGESLAEESFTGGLLEYPQYTRPEEFRGLRAPEALLSGHHENIRKWRLRMRLARTLDRRPDLIEKARRNGLLTAEAQNMIEELRNGFD
ncbi:MAG: tRNA (guanosine(37)-N1)-methyltransferase TrmD [Spirochaetaceae bacterium]|jgi:tRNA (guanine37-N1)-methyltransferase|nr:tRNA (guanosine(37)-N1)-methyltransferase TrmD [Spirochaetaceae bacterium]